MPKPNVPFFVILLKTMIDTHWTVPRDSKELSAYFYGDFLYEWWLEFKMNEIIFNLNTHTQKSEDKFVYILQVDSLREWIC